MEHDHREQMYSAPLIINLGHLRKLLHPITCYIAIICLPTSFQLYCEIQEGGENLFNSCSYSQCLGWCWYGVGAQQLLIEWMNEWMRRCVFFIEWMNEWMGRCVYTLKYKSRLSSENDLQFEIISPFSSCSDTRRYVLCVCVYVYVWACLCTHVCVLGENY